MNKLPDIRNTGYLSFELYTANHLTFHRNTGYLFIPHWGTKCDLICGKVAKGNFEC